MAKQDIKIGASANDGTGDPARTAFTKMNANFAEVYTALGAPSNGAIPSALPVNKGGTGATTAAAARANLGLGNASTSDIINNLVTGDKNSPLSAAMGKKLSDEKMNYGTAGVGSNYNGFTVNSLDATMSPQSFRTSVLKDRDGWYFLTGDIGTWITTPNAPSTHGFFFGTHHFSNNYSYSKRFYTPNFGNNLYMQTAINATTWSPYVFMRHSGNTTVDGNGFLKNASPIVELYADKIELNDEAQQQNIEFEKLGIGDYLVKGSSGFAQEGWYIEQPKDANGNVLVAMVYEQLENNDISVKTYKKKFDLETASIVADTENPADIPAGRWIDIRLQELPQPEPEVESNFIAPPDFQPTNLSEAVQSFMAGGGYASE